MLSKISAKTWVILLVVIVCLVLILLALVAQPASQSPSSTTSEDDTPTEVVLDEPLSPEDFPFVGIKRDDTVAVFNESGEEVVIGLVHNSWNDPKWSPDRSMIAVLGMVGEDNTSVADLFIYELAGNEWTRGSFYSTATDSPPGITGYEWVDSGVIAFSQGESPDIWIHTYDVQNKEISKVFRTLGSLEFYQSENERYVVKVPRAEQETDPTFQVLNKTGASIHIFDSTELPVNHNILTVLSGRSENEYLVHAISGSGNESFVWNFASAEYELLDGTIEVEAQDFVEEIDETTDDLSTDELIDLLLEVSGDSSIETDQSSVIVEVTYICSAGSPLFTAFTPNALVPDSYSILNHNPELKTSRVVAEMNPGKGWEIQQSTSQCLGSDVILNILHPDSASVSGWWQLSGDTLTELEAARNYTQISK